MPEGTYISTIFSLNPVKKNLKVVFPLLAIHEENLLVDKFRLEVYSIYKLASEGIHELPDGVDGFHVVRIFSQSRISIVRISPQPSISG